jgi:chromate transporter
MADAWPTWLSIGATGFGGPAAQVALLHREVVERRRWLDEEEFVAGLRLCTLLPGPEAQQLATYAGWRLHGIAGGLLAGTLFVLPGAVLVTLLAWMHTVGQSLPLVAAAFAGTRPAAVALVAMAVWRIGRKSLCSPLTIAIAAAAGAGLAAGAPFPWVVAAAAAVGGLGWLLERRGPPGDPTPAVGPFLAGPLARHALLVALVAAGVWAASYRVVTATRCAGGRGPEIATLFTETTLLSLGGAYAVVPWALDEAVERRWLEPRERPDALAMGEATPGPLILVVTFIAYLAGWRAAGGPAAGFEAAAVATWFAFLPSFAMIFAFAPGIRRIRTGSLLARAMEAIGAAVVAAIVILALTMGRACLVPEGRLDGFAIAVAVASGLALACRWLPAPAVVLGAAAIGVATRAIGG